MVSALHWCLKQAIRRRKCIFRSNGFHLICKQLRHHHHRRHLPAIIRRNSFQTSPKNHTMILSFAKPEGVLSFDQYSVLCIRKGHSLLFFTASQMLKEIYMEKRILWNTTFFTYLLHLSYQYFISLDAF